MRAIVSSADGPVLKDIPRPSPEPEQVLVQVRASSLNRADLAMLCGAAHGRVGGMGTALGLEWAGEVVEVGESVKRWRVGDRVMAASGGAFADYAVGHAWRIYPVPNDLSFERASSLPVELQTMHDAIATNGMLEAGQSVLIQGASSGVGSMGLQIARYLRAGLVIGTSISRRRGSAAALSMSAAWPAKAASSISTCIRCAASALSASPSAPAARRRWK